ncbi:DMT family transporter [Ectobacillus ponti]|uniref:DMT family transporter n=1 Tax=Ectobacillus ponti TaxID=2961894 RepID=A0AA42BQN7_9BACI|nr:DMT family transporter [Ectobacillus ponti]MCP8970480.1 DMT family transporter [Ectobacillus ponti]
MHEHASIRKRKGVGASSQVKADFTMLVVTMFWGSSYLFTKMGLQSIEGFTILALRFGIAFILAGLVFYKKFRHVNAKTILSGFILGSILFSLVSAVTIGVKFTSISNAGFLFSLSVVFVPLLLAVLFRKKPEKKVVLGVSLSITGIALLTLHSGLEINPGDFLVTLGAVLYSIYIIVTDKLTKNVDSIALGVLQLGFSGVWGLLFSFWFETPQLPDTAQSWTAILALSVLCSAVGFIGQTAAQQYTTPTHTGLIFSLEPVFAAAFAFMFAGEILPAKGYAGAALVLLGVLAAKMDVKALMTRKNYQEQVYESEV